VVATDIMTIRIVVIIHLPAIRLPQKLSF
jgi:hypothetical protein